MRGLGATVSVVSQKQLDVRNITTTTDLTRAVPALTATDEGIFQVRGIGTQGFGRCSPRFICLARFNVGPVGTVAFRRKWIRRPFASCI